MTAIPDAKIAIFFSYAHDDDEPFKFIEPLKQTLVKMVSAKSGRDVDIYVDKAAIVWGSNWRNHIKDGLLNSLLFIPFVSPAYLKSTACRDEFTAFQENAERLGLTGLILPVLPFATDVVSSTSDDEIAKFTDATQYKCIEQPMLHGQGTAAWNLMVADLATSILAVLPLAEAQILALADQADADEVSSTASRMPRADTPPPGQTALNDDDDDDDDDDDGPDYLELTQLAEDSSEELKEVSFRLTSALAELEPAFRTFDPSGVKTAEQGLAELKRVASHISPVAEKIRRDGAEFRRLIIELDYAIRTSLELSAATGDAQFHANQLEKLEIESMIPALKSVEDGIAQITESIIPLEVLSTPLRKALRPARTGMSAIQDGVRLAESWSNLKELDV